MQFNDTQGKGRQVPIRKRLDWGIRTLDDQDEHNWKQSQLIIQPSSSTHETGLILTR